MGIGIAICPWVDVGLRIDSGENLPEEKEKIRIQVRSIARRHSAADLANKSRIIAERLLCLETYQRSRILSSYVSKKGEVDTLGIIRSTLRGGKQVLVPVIHGKTRDLVFSQLLNPDEELAPSSFSIMEPKKGFIRVKPLSSADLIIVPGLAWDMGGYRIGHGFGYYDRALAQVSKIVLKVGLAFRFQVYESLPHTPGDIPVDIIITEENTIKCRRIPNDT